MLKKMNSPAGSGTECKVCDELWDANSKSFALTSGEINEGKQVGK